MALTLNGSTGISGIDGSAGTPALIGSDADTGIFTAAGKVSASINGVEGNVPLVSGTAVASTSGTSIDFTGIPSWVKRVTVMFSGVSTNGTSDVLVQLGDSGGVETSGYTGAATITGTGSSTTSLSSGFLQYFSAPTAAFTRQGLAHLVNISSNTWVCAMQVADPGQHTWCSGSKTLSATLDRVRITTVNGTDTFDAGTINIMYE